MTGILTINIAAPGATEVSNGNTTSSLPGHVWYTVTDGNGNSTSFGFDPIKQGSPFGPGQVVNDDSTVYQGRYFSQSAPITDSQVQALILYGQSTQNAALSNDGQAAGNIDPALSNFNTNYNVLGGAFGVQGLLGNNCISYVSGALQFAGITSGPAFTALALPEWNVGNAANLLNGVTSQNNGTTAIVVEQCGNNDEYTCAITGQYSAPDVNGQRTLLSDNWIGSDGSRGTDVYNSPNNFTSTIVNIDGSSSMTSDVNGVDTYTSLAPNGSVLSTFTDNSAIDLSGMASQLGQVAAEFNAALPQALTTVDSETATFMQQESSLMNQSLNSSIQAMASFGVLPTATLNGPLVPPAIAPQSMLAAVTP